MSNLIIKEESVKLKVAYNFFKDFDCTNIEGDIDFTVTDDKVQGNIFNQDEKEYYLWAEAKRPSQKDIYKLFAQLILTIGKSAYLKNLIPPKFLGAFTSEKIAFIEYADIYEIFSQNDFDWTVRPSNYETKEFKQLYQLVKDILNKKGSLPNIFYFEKDEKELKNFIKKNFKKTTQKGYIRIEVTKTNFAHVYRKWLEDVKPTIDINWEKAEKNSILDVDFFFADLFSENNQTIKQELNALLEGNHYACDRQKDEGLGVNARIIPFKDKQVSHTNFWLKYKRPPKNKYQDYILKRKDLLVPQNIREIRGAYFTPQIWVQKSQEYLTDYLGENWQDEYYIWDCCAGTGNMENGLVTKYNVWASTLDQSDVDIMKDRIKNGTNLLESHVFQFDFLNDDFEKCPKELLTIVQDKEKRKKLIIYINPPYAEVSSIGKKGKEGVNLSKIHEKYAKNLGTAGREIYAQFLCRIYFELKGVIIAEFSKLKLLQSPAFELFRNSFEPKLETMFIAPSYTFDNVGGNFPIGFKIWNSNVQEKFKSILCEVYDDKGLFTGRQLISKIESKNVINRWITKFKIPTKDLSEENKIGFLCGINGNDFQQNRIVYIYNRKEQMANPRGMWITKNNIIECSIYITIRRILKSDWTNDRTQYEVPNDKWTIDKKFHSDCLAMTLFINDIKSNEGINHWIPYTEQEVDAKNIFESHFMSDYIRENKIVFSETAKEVLEAGKKLYKYYHAKNDSNPNASFYDIRMYFQGLNEKGKMNSSSTDETYSVLLWSLRQSLKKLEKQIIPKIYEYGFLIK